MPEPIISGDFLESFVGNILTSTYESSAPETIRTIVNEEYRVDAPGDFESLRIGLESNPPINIPADDHEIGLDFEFNNLHMSLTSNINIPITMNGTDLALNGWLLSFDIRNNSSGDWTFLSVGGFPQGPGLGLIDALDFPVVINTVNFPNANSAYNTKFRLRWKFANTASPNPSLEFSCQEVSGAERYLVDPVVVSDALGGWPNPFGGSLIDDFIRFEMSGFFSFGVGIPPDNPSYIFDDLVINPVTGPPPPPPIPPFTLSEDYKISRVTSRVRIYFPEGSSPGEFQPTSRGNFVPEALGYQPLGRPVYQFDETTKELGVADGSNFDGFLLTTVVSEDEKRSFEKRSGSKALNASFFGQPVTLLTGHGPMVISNGAEPDTSRHIVGTSIDGTQVGGELLKLVSGKWELATSGGDYAWAKYIGERRAGEYEIKVFQVPTIVP